MRFGVLPPPPHKVLVQGFPFSFDVEGGGGGGGCFYFAVVWLMFFKQVRLKLILCQRA